MDQFYEEALRTHPLIFIASGTFWELHELFVGTEWESIGDSIQIHGWVKFDCAKHRAYYQNTFDVNDGSKYAFRFFFEEDDASIPLILKLKHGITLRREE